MARGSHPGHVRINFCQNKAENTTVRYAEQVIQQELVRALVTGARQDHSRNYQVTFATGKAQNNEVLLKQRKLHPQAYYTMGNSSYS